MQLWAHHTVVVGHEVSTGFGLPGSCGHELIGRGGGKRVLGGKHCAPLGRQHVGAQVLIYALAADTHKTYRIGEELPTARRHRALAGYINQRLARAGGKASQVHQPNHRSMVTNLGNYYTTLGVTH